MSIPAISPYKLLKELEMRENAHDTLEGYCRYILEIEPALHHQVICQNIDELLADDYDELIILAPPGSAKSFYTSIALPSYFLGKFPKKHVLTASYSTELAEKWGRKVRNTLDTPIFNSLFNVQLSADSTSAGRWATAQGGEFYAAGVGSGILGFRADLAVIDDPISGFEEAQSITRLSKIHGWYETDLVTRLKPGAKLVLICQRLARNDLAGYLIDRNEANPTRRQRILMLPMEAGENDILGRQPGDRLWPEWYTEGMVTDAKRDDFKWRTLYQQQPPADTGAWASTDDFRFAPTPKYDPKMYTYYGMTDLALSVNSGDYTVHLIVAHNNQTGDNHIADCYRKRVDPDESSNEMVNLAQVYAPVEWLIDDDNASKVYMQLVATRARERGIMVNWKPLPMRGVNKETRAAALRGMFKRGLMYFDPAKVWTNAIINECLQFPNALGAGVDDCVDALGLIGKRLTTLQLVEAPKAAMNPLTIQSMTLDKLFADQPRRSSRL